MSLGRISVKKIFLLTWVGMAISMLAICAHFTLLPTIMTIRILF